MRKIVLSSLVFYVFSAAQAQTINPGIDPVFRPDEIAIIKITIAPETKAFLQDPANAENDDYFPAVFQMKNTLMDTLLPDSIGIRLRGNTSRFHDKKPFKIDFREYGGPRFYGYKKFNLKPNVNDPSFVRELLTLQIYREMNVPAARTHFVKLYMNDEYMGLYLNVEQIDDEFLNMRFGHEEGFLYKCEYGASLITDGQVFNEGIFESEINEDDDTRAELNTFVQHLNNTADAQFVAMIEDEFFVDRYLRQLAVEALLGHWDGYSYNKNNFYLFYDGQQQRFEFFPYDADNTWGIDWVGRDWATRDLQAWAKTDEPRPLTKRILAVPAFKEKYIEYLKQVMDFYFHEDYLWDRFDSYKNLLSDAVATDTYYDNSFGFSHATFLNAFDTGISGSHVDYGLREYVNVRRQKAIEQIPALVTSAADEFQTRVSVYPNPSQKASFTVPYQNKFAVQITNSLGAAISFEYHITHPGIAEVTLTGSPAPGLYLIKTSGQVIKWQYR